MTQYRLVGVALFVIALPVAYFTFSSKSHNEATVSGTSEAASLSPDKLDPATREALALSAETAAESENEVDPSSQSTASAVVSSVSESPERMIANLEAEAAEAVRLEIIDPADVPLFIAQRRSVYESELERLKDEMSEDISDEEDAGRGNNEEGAE